MGRAPGPAARGAPAEAPIFFGKYELLERINVGGMAEIVKARDTQMGDQIVAVKRILPHLLDDQQFITMFLDESRVLTRLDHEFICKAYEVGQVDGTPYIALEYVEGQDARMVFHRSRRDDKRLPIPIACYITAQVCAGLNFAHQLTDDAGRPLGLVHRDVSLQNILLSYDGDVKITDFGIARSAGNESRTEVGIVKGKFGYMSPEQIRGKPLDRRSDVFAAGICLYELLTSERLFSGDSDYAAVEKVRNVDIQPPSQINRQIPSALEKIVMKALAKDVRERYQSAAEMRQALLQFMSTSHNSCVPEQLGAYLRSMFAEELGAATVANRPASAPDHRSAPAAAAPVAAAAAPVLDRARSYLPADEGTGLAAFDNLDPVSTVSELSPSPGVQASPYDGRAQVSAPPARPPQVGGHSVPPVVPRDASIPAGYAPPAVDDGYAPAPPAVEIRDTGDHGAARLDMEWDDDEPPTQSMGMDEVEPLPHPGDVTGQLMMGGGFGGGHQATVQPLSAAVSDIAMPAPEHRSEPTQRAVIDDRSGLPIGPVLGAVVGLLVVIVGGLLLFGDGKPGSIHLTTEPADAVVTVDGKRVPASSSPFVLDSLQPKTLHSIQVDKEGFKPWSTRLTVKPGETMTLPTVTLQPVAPAPTPPTAPAAPSAQPPAADVQAGAPTPEPEPEPEAVPEPTPEPEPEPTVAEERPRKKRTVRKPRRRREPAAAAPKGKGTLRINTRPWSQVFVDGRKVGNTPQMNLSLSAGKHRIKLMNPDFGFAKTLTITIAPGETVTKVLDLP